MPTRSVYLSDDLYEKVRSFAKREGVSLSAYISKVLKEGLDNRWPEGYFDLVGSLKDDEYPLVISGELTWGSDE